MRIVGRCFDAKPWAGWSVSATLHLFLILAVSFILIPFGSGHSPPLEIAAAIQEEALKLIVLDAAPVSEHASEALGFVNFGGQEVADVRIAHPGDVLASQGQGQAGGGQQAGTASVGQTIESGQASFFGTVADGNRFVYILDFSPSMNARRGQRLERAVLELLRSIAQLRDDQEFYVIVFGWHTRCMFGESLLRPKMVNATLENKRKLRRWLASLNTISGTDPRRALQIGLQLNPSAVFLLSDGSFNRPKKTVYFTKGEPDVLEIVRTSGQIPVHTVAFEDKVSVVAMETIADTTGGFHRFVDVPDETARVRRSRLSYRVNSNYKRIVSRFAFADEPVETTSSGVSIEDKARNWIRLAELMEDAGKKSRALDYYERIVRDYPETTAATEASLRLAKDGSGG